MEWLLHHLFLLIDFGRMGEGDTVRMGGRIWFVDAQSTMNEEKGKEKRKSEEKKPGHGLNLYLFTGTVLLELFRGAHNAPGSETHDWTEGSDTVS